MLNKAYKRFLNWKDDRDRKNYDFTWMKEAQEKYPEAFEKTSEFINSVEDDCHKVGMEAGKLAVFSTGGLLWTIIVGVMTWTVTHLDDSSLLSFTIMVGNYQGGVFIGSAIFVFLEMVRFITNHQTNINERILGRLESNWQEILNKQIPKANATHQIELFIAQERSYNIHKLLKSSSGICFGDKAMIILQFIAVIFVAWNGFWQLDAHSRTVRETGHQQSECKPKLECAQRAP